MSEAPFQADQGGDLFPELNEARATISRLNDTRALELRVEALRAAAQVIGRVFAAASAHPDLSESITENETVRSTLDVAEQFAKWLEAGE